MLAISPVSFKRCSDSDFNSSGSKLLSLKTANQNFDSLVDFKAMAK